MTRDLETWQFVRERLSRDEPVMLLTVAASSGSSPGRRGYKLAVGADGELTGSIGGGVMEVTLVERSRAALTDRSYPGQTISSVIEQVHQKNSPNASGMICSGQQSVVITKLGPDDLATVEEIVDAVRELEPRRMLRITATSFGLRPKGPEFRDVGPDLASLYEESIGVKNELVIIGGGHCALALSRLMAKLDFRIQIFDDRPELNTLEKNMFAETITIIDSYDEIAEHVRSSENTYVAVMTLGYKFDEIVIRRLIEHDFKYFGVLGSRAKMATMFRELRRDGLPKERLDAIRTPIGLPINSHSPEEIAVSIAAEIIALKNAPQGVH